MNSSSCKAPEVEGAPETGAPDAPGVRWSRICAVSDIPVLGARTLNYRGAAIALFRTADDRVFALRDRCPHKGGPLSQGIVHGEQVTCPLHGWVIGLRDGAAVAPDSGCAARHAVCVKEGAVWLAAALPAAPFTPGSC
ncbi:MAG TPA: nitrite reductase small subunit NirD [Steroidobacteraceae bacterium]|nr:nitrite reductase small subunit NirD [Steroidobacteraceae bacterium]